MTVFYICIHVFLHVYVWVCLFVYRRQNAAHSLWNNTPMFMHSARVRHRKIYKQNIEFTNLRIYLVACMFFGSNRQLLALLLLLFVYICFFCALFRSYLAYS